MYLSWAHSSFKHGLSNGHYVGLSWLKTNIQSTTFIIMMGPSIGLLLILKKNSNKDLLDLG